MACDHPGNLTKRGDTKICPRCKKVIYQGGGRSPQRPG